MNRQEIKKFLQEFSISKPKTQKVSKQSLTMQPQTRQKKEEPEIASQHLHPKVNQSSKKIIYTKPEYHPETFQLQLMAKNKGKTRESLKWQTQNMKLLGFLYYKVAKEGGIVELLSKGKFDIVAKEIRSFKQEIRHLCDQQILKIYMQYLIKYEFASVGTPLSLKKKASIENTLKNALWVHESNREFLYNKQIQEKYLNEQIVVIQNAVKTFDMENITLQRINRECGDQLVELRIQKPLDFGFNPSKLMNKGDKMTIRQYCEYQKHFDDEKYCQRKFGDKLKGGKVFFAVNFEPSAGTLIQEIKQKLKNTIFAWSQPNDILSYLEQHINGCTNPQFYLKVRGVWTGGHQENVNMCAININHGPSDSQWYSVAGEEMQRLRKALKQQFKLDIYQNEGLWFQKINWFIQNGFEIKRIIQKAGDIVISGPGTLHWVRAFGVSLHSAWNVFPQSQKMLVCAYHRQQQNSKIKFNKSNIIPLKTLTIKHIEHSFATLKQEEKHLLLMNLAKWLSQEQTQLQSIKFHHKKIGLIITHKSLQEHQSFCSECHQQILVYYTQNQTQNDRYCLSCLPDEELCKPAVIYFKWDPKQLFSFICKANLNNLVDWKIKYCSTQHIGRKCGKTQSTKTLRANQSIVSGKQGSENVIKTSIQSVAMQTQKSQQSLKRSSNHSLYDQQQKNHHKKIFHRNNSYQKDSNIYKKSKDNYQRSNYSKEESYRQRSLNHRHSSQQYFPQVRQPSYQNNDSYQQDHYTYHQNPGSYWNNNYQKPYSYQSSYYQEGSWIDYHPNRENTYQDNKYRKNSSYYSSRQEKNESEHSYHNNKGSNYRQRYVRNDYQNKVKGSNNYGNNERSQSSNYDHHYDRKNNRIWIKNNQNYQRDPYENNSRKLDNKQQQYHNQKQQEMHLQDKSSESEISY